MTRLVIWIRVGLVVVFLAAAAPLLLLAAAAALAGADLAARLRRRPTRAPDTAPGTGAVSIVIPNWNGRELLEKYLPSVVAAAAELPASEVMVVDNASTDGSRELLRERFPGVRLEALDRNLGFGGGSNAGFRSARHDIVVLLNSDMRVDPGFLPPLVEAFRDPRVFAVSAQIFFADPSRKREETGLTEGRWIDGRLWVRHVIDERVSERFPVFYPGGGSSAFDRRKFLELGGFDSLFEPFYLEDTDLGYQAWKRGWTVHYEPRSMVWHEHRGTIGRTFQPAYIQAVLKKNYLLWAWKNIHDWGMLAGHLGTIYGAMWLRLLGGDTPARPSPGALVAAFRRLGGTMRSRIRARRLAVISDQEAFRRPLGGYYRDRFETPDPARHRLNVLFLSPYPIRPPVHGGAVFMGQTLEALAQRARVHLICLLDFESELEANRRLESVCASVELLVRMPHDDGGWNALAPHAARVFTSRDLDWRIHRTIFVEKVDAVQMEYTQLAVYAMEFRRIATFLFEHDVYFQSVGRLLRRERSPIRWVKTAFEYLRALRFELRAIERFDAVQVCTPANGRYLGSFGGRARLVEGLRAGIDVGRYRYVAGGREPDTLLFVGNFRHLPNQEALLWLWQRVWPLVRRDRPQARLIIVGAEAGPNFAEIYTRDGSEFRGQVEDIREPLERYAVFVCPVLSGSGVRVKLLEAFAAGIPAVSTSMGAEGLAGEWLEVADDPGSFAASIVELLADPARARAMAQRARQEVERNWDIRLLTERLEAHYREVVASKAVTLRAPR